jgi:putative DeoR family transcriptional regulator (stage III sporulation protein D)
MPAKGGGPMQDYILQRVIDVANYILDTGFTVRQTAQIFGVSKSTVHKDVTERLPQINENLAQDVRVILEKNKAERHLRGGEATRLKYSSLRAQ